ncbi:hypothetical protein PoB_000404000 [Plakobranchus ocellatus]|uniref:Uncharacterized protein n=1 Tax=Plakobranchus ocellatus TaxID=259542 RepID=A0AAV3Y3X0_9GAST|nr:hypothetical protein PoB_000404000 [Plakobranchus ocellatus]
MLMSVLMDASRAMMMSDGAGSPVGLTRPAKDAHARGQGILLRNSFFLSDETYLCLFEWERERAEEREGGEENEEEKVERDKEMEEEKEKNSDREMRRGEKELEEERKSWKEGD